MPKKSKRQKPLKINLPKLKCLSLIPDKLNAAKLTSQINETNESNNRVQSDETNDVEIDEEDEDENDNDIITSVDTSNSSNFDLDWDLHNPVANDINEEDENNLIFNHSDSEEFDDSNDIDDDDEDEDEDDDNENFGFKRRRLNSIGKYKIIKWKHLIVQL